MKIYSSINDRLRSQHHVIYELIKDLDNNLIDKQPAKDKWSIRDNIAHIAYYHLKFLIRMKLILSGKENVFKSVITSYSIHYTKLYELLPIVRLLHYQNSRESQPANFRHQF